MYLFVGLRGINKRFRMWVVFAAVREIMGHICGLQYKKCRKLD